VGEGEGQVIEPEHKLDLNDASLMALMEERDQLRALLAASEAGAAALRAALVIHYTERDSFISALRDAVEALSHETMACRAIAHIAEKVTP